MDDDSYKEQKQLIPFAVPALPEQRKKLLRELSNVLDEIFSSERPNAKNWRNRTVIVQSFIHKHKDADIARAHAISPTHVARIKDRFLKQVQRFRHRFTP